MRCEPLGQVQGDDVDVERSAGLLEGLFISGSRGYEIVVLLELRDAEVGRCVCEEDVAAAEDPEAGGHWEGDGVWDGGGLVDYQFVVSNCEGFHVFSMMKC